MDKNQKDLYYVAVKIFLEKEGRLFIFKDRFGDWDIPGGRLLENEFTIPLDKIAVKKIKEELGNKIKYRLGEPMVFMRHERKEQNPLGRSKARIFAIGYQTSFLKGEIKLSTRHSEYKWVPMKSFKPETCFTGGWLKGVKEYLKSRR